MEENTRIEKMSHYVKGNKDDIIRRFGSIHTLTMFCPIQDEGMNMFRTILASKSNEYMKNSNMFVNVPALDSFMCCMETLSCCKEGEINTLQLYTLWGFLQSFSHLKFITFEFVNDDEVLESYNYMRGKDKSKSLEMIQKIYRIDMLEFVLSNMFTQDVIDILNKIMTFDEILPNSYLERAFLIEFEYDEYISYMNMVVSNIAETLNNIDPDIIDYLLMFPKIVSLQKPKIRLLTNYRDD